MTFRLIEAYIIKGLICSKEQKLILDDKNIKAYVTKNPDELLKEIDIKKAIDNILLTSIFFGRPEGSINDLIAPRVEDIKKKRPGGCYLIIEGTGELNEYNPKDEREQEGLHLALDAVDGDLIRREFKDQINIVLTAFSLFSDTIIGVDKITDGILLYKNNKDIIYPLSLKGGNSFAYANSQLDYTSLEDLPKLFKILQREKGLKQTLDLLATSLKARNERLKTFLTCWTALEIFVNKYFNRFEKEFFTELRAGEHPEVREQYLNRISVVMKDKYRLNDKFGIIALRLSPATADIDANIFNSLKKQRDDMIHGGEINEKELDIANAQSLLAKYLKLFLYHKVD